MRKHLKGIIRLTTSRCSFCGHFSIISLCLHKLFIVVDIDVYFDEDGIYFCDITGHVFWYDLLLPTSDPEYLPADLLVNELSVDWLSNKLYIASFYSQVR